MICGLVLDHLKGIIDEGGISQEGLLTFFKKRLKIRASHVSIKYLQSPHTDVCCSHQIFATPKLDWG